MGWVGSMAKLHFEQHIDAVDAELRAYTETCYVTDNSFIAQCASSIRALGDPYRKHRRQYLRYDVARTMAQRVSLDELVLRLQGEIISIEGKRRNGAALAEISTLPTLDILVKRFETERDQLVHLQHYNLSICKALSPRVNTICYRTATSTSTLWTSVLVQSVSSTESSQTAGLPTPPLKRTKRMIIED